MTRHCSKARSIMEIPDSHVAVVTACYCGVSAVQETDMRHASDWPTMANEQPYKTPVWIRPDAGCAIVAGGEYEPRPVRKVGRCDAPDASVMLSHNLEVDSVAAGVESLTPSWSHCPGPRRP